MTELALDQCWECPRCGSQIAMGRPAEMHPPTCQWGHAPAEMEQVMVSRFGTQEWNRDG